MSLHLNVRGPWWKRRLFMFLAAPAVWWIWLLHWIFHKRITFREQSTEHAPR